MDKVASRTITTHWLLTVSRLSEEDEWSSTTTGYDTFEKVLDSPEEKYLSADPDAQERIDEAIVRIQDVLRSARSQLMTWSAEQEVKAA